MTWESLFAKLTFECLPAIGLDTLSLLLGPLGVEPFTKAFEMDVAHGAGTFARRDQWVTFLVLFSEADTAHFLLGGEFRFLNQE